MSTTITADVTTNLLEVKYLDHVGVADMETCLTDVEKALASLRPNFSVLTDLERLETMELSCVPYLDKIMDRCKEKGVGKIVRIIPNPAKDIGFNVMSLFHYTNDIPIITCETKAEAARALA